MFSLEQRGSLSEELGEVVGRLEVLDASVAFRKVQSGIDLGKHHSRGDQPVCSPFAAG